MKIINIFYIFLLAILFLFIMIMPCHPNGANIYTLTGDGIIFNGSIDIQGVTLYSATANNSVRIYLGTDTSGTTLLKLDDNLRSFTFPSGFRCSSLYGDCSWSGTAEGSWIKVYDK